MRVDSPRGVTLRHSQVKKKNYICARDTRFAPASIDVVLFLSFVLLGSGFV